MEEAIGMIETKGLVASNLAGTDVAHLGGSGYVSVIEKGDVAACKAAVDAGASAAGRIGEVVSVHVIPRPHGDVGDVLPNPPAKKK